MHSIKHILVVVDPAAAEHPGLDKAARIASATGATLELFVCDYPAALFSSRFARDDVLQAAVKQRRAELDLLLHALAAPLRASGAVLTDMSFQQSLHLGVVSKALACGADLVVKDTHYHGPARRALFSNADWQLLRECPVLLLLTKPAPWPARVRVAAALDPGHVGDKPAALDRALLDVTESMAASLHGEACAVHAFDSLPLVAGMATAGNALASAPFVDVQLLDTLRQCHDQEFRALLAGRAAFAGHAELLDGSPLLKLPEYVERHAVDVLVAGAVSRSVARRLFLGSTAERLLDRVPSDILIVKPTPAEEK